MKARLGVVILIIAMVLCNVGLLAGCSSSTTNEEGYSDEAFIKSMSKGLEARWAMTDKASEGEETKEDMEKYIQAELDQLTPYEAAKFEDTKLQEKVLKYINCLKESKDNIDAYFNGDEKWEEIRGERAALIKDFVENYGLTVSDKYQAKLDEFVAQGSAVEKKASQDDAMQKLVKKTKFKQTKDDGYGWKTYESILENTTDYDIVSFSLDVNLLDKDGVNVSTQYASVENVKKGQKAILKFETNEVFDKIDLTLSYYELKQ